MKRLLLPAVLFLSALTLVSGARAGVRPAAEIVSIDGTGEYLPKEGERWSMARVDQDLFPGNYVRTGRFSRMGLLFRDRTQIRINEKTLLRVKAIRKPAGREGKNILRLFRGRAWTQSKEAPGGLLMETPSATAAIRGTDWDLEVDENGASTITVLSGQVIFYNDFGTVIVNKDEQARAQIGKAPVKMVMVRPEDRVQWVTAYAVDPLRHISLYGGGPDKLKRALKDKPGPTARALAERGSILADMGRWDEAASDFQAALKRDSNNSRALIGSAYAALHHRYCREAEMYFNRVQAVDPKIQELLELGRIGVHILNRNPAPAYSRLHALTGRIRLHQPAAYMILSDLMIYSGDIPQAIRLVETALTRFPEDARVYSQLARIHLVHGQPEQSRERIRQALAVDPESYEARIVRGDLSRIQGDAKQAVSAYNEAARLKPDDDRAWYGLGVTRAEQENIDVAREYLARALELNPEGSGYRGEQGTLETFADNFRKAAPAFQAALADNPADYTALTGQGLMQLKQGQTEAALDSFLRAGLMEPRYARARMYTAVAYYQLGKIAQALEELQRASELDDKDPMPHFLASIIYTDLLRPADAVKEARKALNLMPFLKSLNQLANTRRGTTNLGQAFAFMGMEDWSRMYAQQSYNPYWAGSHLFLADRYTGLFTKNSELFQGFMTDPTVFGADNRFQRLINRPGHGFNASLRATKSDAYDGHSPLVELSGFENSISPFAYYLGYENFDLDFESGPYETYSLTAALGAMPAHDIGLFAFADHSNLETGVKAMFSGYTFDYEEDLDTDRLDVGFNYKLSPTSQLWLKSGHFRSDDNVGGFITEPLFFDFPLDMDLDVDVRSPEFGFRHTFTLKERHELSWGVEAAHRKTTTDYSQLDLFDSVFIWGTDAYDAIHQKYSERSEDVYLSDRIKVNSNLLVQLDLFYQRHHRKAHQDFDWHLPFYPDLVFEQAPDVDDRFKDEQLNLRLGGVCKWGAGKLIRFAYQDWIRPSSQGTLGPVATAGIPLDDRLVLRGGELKRYRGQLEWEASPRAFISAYYDYKEIDNNLFSITTPFAVNELESLNRLRPRDLGALARQDLLEFVNTPEYGGGEIESAGISSNYLLNKRWGLWGKYIYTASRNTGDEFKGNDVPYLPEHTAAAGATWTHPDGWYFVCRLVYRTMRYTDEANTVELKPSLDGAADIYWQSKKKHWLLRFSVDEVFDRNQDTQYTAEFNLKF